jgi:DNA polymerase/3'-5' exonuclease PolX
MAEIGTKMLPGIGADIGERIQELKSTGGADTAAAIKQVAGEFKTAMLEAVQKMGGGDTAVAADQLSALTQLVQEQRNSNSIQEKLLRAQAS